MAGSWGWIALGGVVIVGIGAWYVVDSKAKADAAEKEKVAADNAKKSAAEKVEAARLKSQLDLITAKAKAKEIKQNAIAEKAQQLSVDKIQAQYDIAKMAKDQDAMDVLKDIIRGKGGTVVEGYGFSYDDPSSYWRVGPKIPGLYIGSRLFKNNVGRFSDDYFSSFPADFGKQNPLYIGQ